MTREEFARFCERVTIAGIAVEDLKKAHGDSLPLGVLGRLMEDLPGLMVELRVDDLELQEAKAAAKEAEGLADIVDGLLDEKCDKCRTCQFLESYDFFEYNVDICPKCPECGRPLQGIGRKQINAERIPEFIDELRQQLDYSDHTQLHVMASEIRKMTDAQLVDYVDRQFAAGVDAGRIATGLVGQEAVKKIMLATQGVEDIDTCRMLEILNAED
jgi:hypothetical protein